MALFATSPFYLQRMMRFLPFSSRSFLNRYPSEGETLMYRERREAKPSLEVDINYVFRNDTFSSYENLKRDCSYKFNKMIYS